MQTLSNFLKKSRTNAKMSQSELAERMGYSSPQFISSWENNKASPPLNSLAKLCEILGIKPERLQRVLVQEYKRYIGRCINEPSRNKPRP